MQATAQHQAVQTIEIGPDRLTLTSQQLIIDAAHEMPDWKVREYRHVPIYFRDHKFLLCAKRNAPPPHSIRYILEPWPEDLRTAATGHLFYNEETVAAREANLSRSRLEFVLHGVLAAFYPLLGFLWSGTKEKLSRFGFAARDVTATSILVSFLVVYIDLAFAAVFLMAHAGIGGLLLFLLGPSLQIGPVSIQVAWLDLLLFVVLSVDLVTRYGQHLKNDEREQPWGLLEWIFHSSHG